jgi:hypothetical protein
MNGFVIRWRAWLWWLIPLVALAVLLAVETDGGRALNRLPEPAPVIEPKPVVAALLPEYRIDGGLESHSETVSRTLFNPTRRPAPAIASDGARRQMTRGQFVLTGTAVAGERHIAFLKEVAGNKSRVVRQGEQLNGLTVASVTADRVKLTLGDESEELVLKVAAGPKTTTQPAPAAAVPPPGGTAPGGTAPAPVTPLPGAVRPVEAPAADLPRVPVGRRVAPAGGPASAFPAAAEPASTPAAAPAPTQGTTNPAGSSPTPAAGQAPASADPGWNETFERMRQRNPQPSK